MSSESENPSGINEQQLQNDLEERAKALHRSLRVFEKSLSLKSQRVDQDVILALQNAPYELKQLVYNTLLEHVEKYRNIKPVYAAVFEREAYTLKTHFMTENVTSFYSVDSQKGDSQ